MAPLKRPPLCAVNSHSSEKVPLILHRWHHSNNLIFRNNLCSQCNFLGSIWPFKGNFLVSFYFFPKFLVMFNFFFKIIGLEFKFNYFRVLFHKMMISESFIFPFYLNSFWGQFGHFRVIFCEFFGQNIFCLPHSIHFWKNIFPKISIFVFYLTIILPF